MLNECEGCGTRFAHDLEVCPHCGRPRTAPVLVVEVGPEVVDLPKGGAVKRSGKGEG